MSRKPLPKPSKRPRLVQRFLAGKYINATHSIFVAIIRKMGRYVGVFLTLDLVKHQTYLWMENNGYLDHSWLN